MADIISDALVTVVSPKILGNDVNRSAPPSGCARSSKQFTMRWNSLDSFNAPVLCKHLEEAGTHLTSGMPPSLQQLELSQAGSPCFDPRGGGDNDDETAYDEATPSDSFAKIAADVRTAGFLSDPSFMNKIQEVPSGGPSGG